MRVKKEGNRPDDYDTLFEGACGHCFCEFECNQSDTQWESPHDHVVSHWFCSLEVLRHEARRYATCPNCRRPVHVVSTEED